MTKNGPSFWARGPGLILFVLVTAAALAAAGGIALLHTITHPARARQSLDPADLLMTTEDATFASADGERLSGWFVKGRPGGTAIVLCHDLGGSRSSLMNAAVLLNRAGYPLLLFDLRAHGQSGGTRATLGMEERQDILGALTYLRARKDVQGDRFGAWGVGMGAYAVVLAALEDKQIVALALDSLYPDVGTHLDRLVRQKMPPALAGVVPAVHLLYNPFFLAKLDRFSLDGRLAELAGRDILFIAGSDSPERLAEERALYEAMPEGPGGEKNFLELKVSGVSGLYDSDRKTYDQTLVDFFTTHLPRDAGRAVPPKKPIEVLEK